MIAVRHRATPASGISVYVSVAAKRASDAVRERVILFSNPGVDLKEGF